LEEALVAMLAGKTLMYLVVAYRDCAAEGTRGTGRGQEVTRGLTVATVLLISKFENLLINLKMTY
jgi:hypothetical protein